MAKKDDELKNLRKFTSNTAKTQYNDLYRRIYLNALGLGTSKDTIIELEKKYLKTIGGVTSNQLITMWEQALTAQGISLKNVTPGVWNMRSEYFAKVTPV